ncbi:unnamed protein product [Arabis nemorensis]|uniref:Uncharacterized protein n=1 Tax=Arabis nemorensis TaxID=586526 RepID=A0A565CB07_9BRAS|nr:unnamed protein product [Arabis nemorensis]
MMVSVDESRPMNLSNCAGSRFKTARLKDGNRYSVAAADSAVYMRPCFGPHEIEEPKLEVVLRELQQEMVQ